MTQDLSDAFGRPAASALRGLLPPRPSADPARSRATQGGTPDSRRGPDGSGGDLVPGGSDDAAEDAVDDEFDDDEFDDDEFDDEGLDAEGLDDDGLDDEDPVDGDDGDPVDGDDEFDDGDDGFDDGDSSAAADPGGDHGSRAVAGATDRAMGRTSRTGGRHPREPRRDPRGTSHGGHDASASVTSANRRWGVTRIATREHVDLLVLLALRPGPANGFEVMARLREDSGGALHPPERTVHRTLHRLTRNRLLVRRVERTSGRARYALTEGGRRALRARVRAWRSLVATVDAVVRAGDPA